jgi:hypothetical protein
MKYSSLNKTFLVLAAICLLSCGAFAQKARAKSRKSIQKVSQHLIFAVMNDGKTLEPVGMIKDGKIETTTAGDSDAAALKSFAANYYKAGTAYDLIFGGSPMGKIIVKSSNLSGECGKNLAQASLSPVNSSIKGLVMALATNAKIKNTRLGIRRKPTPDERSEIEKLVRAELKTQNIPDAALKKLRYQNLTALDVDNNGDLEFVGSYWTETAADRRDLLFFIADKNVDGTYSLSYKDYSKVTPDDVMSGKLKDFDGGIGHELLIDAFDYDNDGVSEIFTVTEGFEGNNFRVYKSDAGNWKQVFEASNYHCAF